MPPLVAFAAGLSVARADSPPIITSQPWAYVHSPSYYLISSGAQTLAFRFTVTNHTGQPLDTRITFVTDRILTYYGKDVRDGQPGQPGVAESDFQAHWQSTTQQFDMTRTTQSFHLEPEAVVTVSFSAAMSVTGYYQLDAFSDDHPAIFATGFTRVVDREGGPAPTPTPTPTPTPIPTPTPAPSSTPPATPPPVVPGAPTGVRASAGDGQASVTWTAPADGGSPILRYTVFSWLAIGSALQRPGQARAGERAGQDASGTSAVVTGLQNGVAYAFTVTATNGVGTGPESQPSNTVIPTGAQAAGQGSGPGPGQPRPQPVPPLRGDGPVAPLPVVAAPGAGVGVEVPVPAVVQPPSGVDIGAAFPPGALPQPLRPGVSVVPLVFMSIVLLGTLGILVAAGHLRGRRTLETQAMLAGALGISRRRLSRLGPGEATLVLAKVSELSRRVSALESQAVTDDLTGLLRRGAGLGALERDLARLARAGTGGLAVVFLDVDGLKAINDTSGHLAGDRMLRQVAQALSAGLRGEDLVFRYGGDEFVCVLQGATAEAAWTKVESIRRQLEAELGRRPFTHGSAEASPGDAMQAVLARADADLYRRRGPPKA